MRTLGTALPALAWALVPAPLSAQTAETLSQVRSVYVAPFGGATGAEAMRRRLIQQLAKTQAVRAVSGPAEADAIAKGTARLWVTGYYSMSPRTQGSRQATYQGYLSLELVGKDDATLWSYLVSPSRTPWRSTSDDLADQMAKELLAAVRGDARSPSSPGGEPGVQGALQGAGATFPAPLYKLWFESFEKQRPGVQIRYDAVGSGAGLLLLGEGKIDFAGSDVPAPARRPGAGPGVLQFPSVVGGVVPIYNLKGMNASLNFTPEALAGIYLGTIRRWNDPRIAAANPGALLPPDGIRVIHRSDASGTSFVWTDYLSKTSPEWKAAAGADMTVTWPVGIGAEGNEGVAALVGDTPSSIGYVEFIYALQHELSFGSVRNAAGRYVRASLRTVEAAAAGAAETLGPDLGASISDAPGPEAYPIASFTWVLFPREGGDKNRRGALLALLRWILTSGQKQCSVLGYAPLPPRIAKAALDAVPKSE